MNIHVYVCLTNWSDDIAFSYCISLNSVNKEYTVQQIKPLLQNRLINTSLFEIKYDTERFV